jgi:hypothetical protein
MFADLERLAGSFRTRYGIRRRSTRHIGTTGESVPKQPPAIDPPPSLASVENRTVSSVERKHPDHCRAQYQQRWIELGLQQDQ